MRKILAALSVVAFASPVLAQTPDFATADADKSGGVSWEELQAAWPGADEEKFKAADADQSGDLNENEFGTFSAS